MADWIIEDAPGTPETFGQQAKRVLTSTGLSLLEGLEPIAEMLGEGPRRRYSEIYKERTAHPQEYFEPQSLPEAFLNKFASVAPGAALGGGIPALARSAIGSGAGAIAQQLGAPKAIQDISQLLTELGSGAIAARIPGAKGIIPEIPSINQLQKAEDIAARKAVSSKELPLARPLNTAIKNVEKALLAETDRKTSKDIIHTLNQLSQNIFQRRINPTKAMDLRASLYSQARGLDKNIAAKYIQPLTKGINDFFAVYAAENPTFYKHLNARDRLTELKNMNSYILSYVNSIPYVGPIGQKVLEPIIGQSEKFVRGLLTNSQARKYYFDIVLGLTQNNPSLVTRNLEKLATKFPNLIESPEKSNSEWIIV